MMKPMSWHKPVHTHQINSSAEDDAVCHQQSTPQSVQGAALHISCSIKHQSTCKLMHMPAESMHACMQKGSQGLR